MSDPIDYGYEALFGIPPEMGPWNMQLVAPFPAEFGEYVLVGCEQASIELHHQVEVVDESGDPLRGVWVIFGFPGGGPNINLPVRRNFWRQGPVVLQGNAQRTNAMGYAQHTFASGGEDIWIWDIDKEGDLKLPSVIVKNCTWLRTPVGRFEHTGVSLTFQRRMVGVTPRRQRLDTLEQQLQEVLQRLSALEAKVG